jgi:heme/copper-type cytochrome/quinol oxidase subunit 3
MKTKNKKPFLNMDERNKTIAYKVIAVMYFLTIIAMQGVVLYRQFTLGQEMSDFEDIAIIMTINSLFLISALLYFGAIQIRRLKIKSILLIYVVFVVLGTLFTYAKYNIFQTPGLSIGQLFDKLIIIISIIGLIMGFWILLSIVAKKRIDKELE